MPRRGSKVGGINRIGCPVTLLRSTLRAPQLIVVIVEVIVASESSGNAMRLARTAERRNASSAASADSSVAALDTISALLRARCDRTSAGARHSRRNGVNTHASSRLRTAPMQLRSASSSPLCPTTSSPNAMSVSTHPRLRWCELPSLKA